MASILSLPDVNLWFVLAVPEHPHHSLARRWWQQHEGPIVFARLSQLGLLRILTTAAAMDAKPVSITEAWRIYDRFYEDDRVAFLPEPSEADEQFRAIMAGRAASPKMWTDAWLVAQAKTAGGIVVTLDKALASRGAHCLLNHRA